jgi:hypothetical protein
MAARVKPSVRSLRQTTLIHGAGRHHRCYKNLSFCATCSPNLSKSIAGGAGLASTTMPRFRSRSRICSPDFPFRPTRSSCKQAHDNVRQAVLAAQSKGKRLALLQNIITKHYICRSRWRSHQLPAVQRVKRQMRPVRFEVTIVIHIAEVGGFAQHVAVSPLGGEAVKAPIFNRKHLSLRAVPCCRAGGLRTFQGGFIGLESTFCCVHAHTTCISPKI